MRNRVLIATLMTGLVLTSAGFAQGQHDATARTLNEQELRTILVGKKIGGTNTHGQYFIQDFRADGLVVGTSTLGKAAHANSLGGSPLIFDRGKWEIKDDQMCVTWYHWHPGKTFCSAVATDRKHYYYVNTGIALTFAGLAQGQHDATARVLNEQELRALLVGKKIGGTSMYGQYFIQDFRADGLVVGTSTLGKPAHANSLDGSPLIFDRGKWEIKDDQMCVTWYHWQSGKTFCRAVATDSKHYYYANSGTAITLVP